jgi:phosphoribosylformylglycinamidine synthase
MTPYEVMLSESQERMLLVAERGREREVLDVFKKWGLDAVVIGEVKDGEVAVVKNHGGVAAEIPAHPLAEEGPVYQRPLSAPARRAETEKDWFAFATEGAELTENFKKLLASPAIASKRWITEQYDTSVRTNTLAGPGASDAAVVRIKESEKNGVMKALALATDGNGRWCQLDAKVGAMQAVAEAARNVAASGARPIAATNCLNFGSPEKPEVMWQFSQAIDGIGEACTVLGTPITGGNVSFYNETLGKSIYPTPVIGVLGILDDASRVMKIGFRNAGDKIVLMDGAEEPARHAVPLQAEFSSSEYAKRIAGIVAGEPPAIDLTAEKRLIDCLVAIAAQGIAVSAHDISDGGIAVTLAESCFAAKGLGATVKLPDDAAEENALFGERGARCVVSVAPEKVGALRTIAGQYGVAASEIGQVTSGDSLRIEYKGQAVIDSQVKTLRDVWANALERTLAAK